MLIRARLFARSASRRSALVGALLACLALAGCADETPDDPPPDNNAPRGPRPPAAQPATGAAQQTSSSTGRIAPKGPKPLDPYLNPTAAAAEASPEAAAAAEEKPRDYGAELVSAARGADTCVKPRLASEALPAEVSIALEGLVLESGTIVSGSANAPVLTPEELECVKRRLESTRIPGDVRDAPRRVSGTLKLTFKRQEPAAPAPAAAPTPAAPSTY